MLAIVNHPIFCKLSYSAWPSAVGVQDVQGRGLKAAIITMFGRQRWWIVTIFIDAIVLNY